MEKVIFSWKANLSYNTSTVISILIVSSPKLKINGMILITYKLNIVVQFHYMDFIVYRNNIDYDIVYADCALF